MPIDRPPTSTIMWEPGSIWSTVPTTYFGIVPLGAYSELAGDSRRKLAGRARRELVQLAGVPAHQLLLEAGGQLRLRQTGVRRVEIPVRVVGGEHQLVLEPGRLLQQLDELMRHRRLLHWLGGEPEMLGEVFRRLAPELRDFSAQ